MKYGKWNIGTPDSKAVMALRCWGISPLNASVLAVRGFDTPAKAAAFFTPEQHISDPMLLRDMDLAVARVRLALSAGEKIAVFGDYDVDGITATCLLADYLHWQGADVTEYIPMRLEEGYGLNRNAIASLHEQGVSLLITVDCGITAAAEAEYCRELGMDLVITDHHECRDTFPTACAVVNPHRPDNAVPDLDFAGVGVAFKLVSALSGDQSAMLDRYSDLLCLGTVADVIPLVQENRCFVSAGLRALSVPKRPGLRALMAECNCGSKPVTAGTIGYILAPRINAAGRMGKADLALELFMTDSPARAQELAATLCRLNRQRQAIEQDIYAEAVSMLAGQPAPSAIVLASETWHQGVVGIVASRLAEEYSCPAFLICLDGEHGKASSRSWGGFNLYEALEANADLLENYGGHELAAGFTIHKDSIDAFRTAMEERAAEFANSGQSCGALTVDCTCDPRDLTLQNVAELDLLQPCSAGFASPVFCLQDLTVMQLSSVGGGKHLRLRLADQNGSPWSAIFFNHTAAQAGVSEGDIIEAAFTPQINEYRGMRSVQFNLVDLRQKASVREQLEWQHSLFLRMRAMEELTAAEAAMLLPAREDFAVLWRYLSARQEPDDMLVDDCACLCRKISRAAGRELSFTRLLVCLDVLQEQGLIQLEHRRSAAGIRLTAGGRKVDLSASPILIRLRGFTGTGR